MKDIAIYGAGGFGREVAAVLSKLTKYNPEGWNLVGFFDDGKIKGCEVGQYGKVLGGIEELNSWGTELCIALCFGIPSTIRAVREKIRNPNISFPNLVNNDFYISDSSTFSIGEGNIIQGGCAVTVDIRIGNFNLLNGSVVFGHDITTGDYNVFMPACRVSGEVTIGNECLLGSMSFVKQQIKIADNVTLSPLSALLTKPKSGNTYIGNPAKIFKY